MGGNNKLKFYRRERRGSCTLITPLLNAHLYMHHNSSSSSSSRQTFISWEKTIFMHKINRSPSLLLRLNFLSLQESFEQFKTCLSQEIAPNSPTIFRNFLKALVEKDSFQRRFCELFFLDLTMRTCTLLSKKEYIIY